MFDKIIFLDIDGVLCIDPTLNASHRKLDSGCCGNLKKIIDKTQSRIVISSTWRNYDHTYHRLLQFFKEHQLPEPIDITPNLLRESLELTGKFIRVERKEEILSWLIKNPTNRFVIIDDEGDAALTEESFFQTDSDVGLTTEQADAIILYMNKEEIL